jgi:hypothetical protein
MARAASRLALVSDASSRTGCTARKASIAATAPRLSVTCQTFVANGQAVASVRFRELVRKADARATMKRRGLLAFSAELAGNGQ